MNWNIVCGIIFMIGSMIALYFCIRNRSNTRVTGVAVDNKVERGIYFTIVEYEYEGVRYRKCSSIGHKHIKYDKGEPVILYHSPKQKSVVYLAGDYNDIYLCMSCFLLGILIILDNTII